MTSGGMGGTNTYRAKQSEMYRISIIRFRRWNKVLSAHSSSVSIPPLVVLLNPLPCFLWPFRNSLDCRDEYRGYLMLLSGAVSLSPVLFLLLDVAPDIFLISNNQSRSLGSIEEAVKELWVDLEELITNSGSGRGKGIININICESLFWVLPVQLV